ncbi:CBS domain-containing protein CBSX5-like isoform X1 [Salvia splendens]|uniref:CBS domain-containing protein CBSX5-like isoform X1 n=1 Tax=Salvia splendens TaxID=180675 RepID=UPI0011051111|nr:CBS domain-containing protein CBSX5-like isoform X1 [Salvia splendens]
MALRSLSAEVSDLCIGKPELKWIAATASIAEALAALKASGEIYISVWICSQNAAGGSCVCVGKFSAADVILFLCREENLADPFKALQTPVCDILPKGIPIVRCVTPNSSLLEAMDYMLDGTQNLVVPIQNQRFNYARKRLDNRQQLSSSCHEQHECCWLTQEDVLRFILNSVGSFSPVTTYNLESLNIIDRDIMTITHNKPASSALGYFHRAITEQKSVAVVDEENRLMGEISPQTLAYCDETAASAIMVLSAIDLMAYVDCGSPPPEDLVQLVKTRLEERNLGGMVDMMDESIHPSLLYCSSSSSLSSDDDFVSGMSKGSSRGSSRHYAAGRCEPLVCSPRSSLLAVMMQALAYRVSCVWVVEEDHTLVGTVTLAGILSVFLSVADGMHSKP